MQEKADLTDIALTICKTQRMIFRGKVGEGAFKQTFHVENENSESFALKLYNINAGPERTIREIEAMAKCSHTAIARIFKVDTFLFAGSQYVFTLEEFLSGGTLHHRLADRGLLNRLTVLEFGNQLLSAIAHIASLGLVHRDIKPENILFRDERFNPVITDFGIVRDLNAESLTATWFAHGPGTPYFAAPEQMNNEKHMTDWRTDQFSCGIVLSICAFGLHPYDYGRDETLLAMAERRETTKAFKEAIERYRYPVLGRMVEGWPVKRYRNVNELIRDWNAQGD